LKSRIICTVTNELTFDQRMNRICTSLVDLGYDVLLIGRERSSDGPLEKRAYHQSRLKCIFNYGPLFYLEYNLRLFFLLRKEKFQFIHSVDLDTILAANLLKKIKSFTWVYDAHEYFTEVPELQGRTIVKSIWKRLEKIALNKCDEIITVSHSIAREFEKVSKKSVHVIRNVPKLRSRNIVKPKLEEVSIIYQGALNEGRCIEHYILAMRNLDARLYIAGEGDLSAHFREVVQNESLQEKVIFLGKLSPEALWEETQKAHLGLNVLEHRGQSYFYSLSNKCFDYIQAGIPQLCSEFPEYVHLNDRWNAITFAKPEVKDIESKVKLLINDRDLYKRLSDNAEIASKQLHWSNEEEKLKEIYG